MKVEWTSQAKSAVRKTIKYVEDNFGKRSALSLAKELVLCEQYLANNPYIGKIEPLLDGRAVTYRCLIVRRLNKIIYRIDNECVTIVDFWNLRRSPENLQKQVK